MGCECCGAALPPRNRRFCSRACRIAFYETPALAFTCQGCGAEAWARRREGLSKRRYCSRACYRRHHNRSHLSGARNGRWRGGRALAYGPGWKQLRQQVRARDRVCRRCGKTPEQNGRALDVHHLQPFRFSGVDALEQLVALCRSCHMRADDHGRRGSAAFLAEVGRPPAPSQREIRRREAKSRRAARAARRELLAREARRARADGASLREIARTLGVSHQTVAGWLARDRLTEAAVPYAVRCYPVPPAAR